MWNLVVYELIPWDSLIHVAKIGGYQRLEDCLYMYSYIIEGIAKSDLVGTYIPMCVRVL